MSQSILLQLARHSIEEVLEAKRTINRESLLKEFPILEQQMASYITLKLDNKIRGSFGTLQAKQSLLEDIIFNAKSAAFLDKNISPLSTSEYLHCSIEIALLTPLQAVNYTSVTDLKDKLTPHVDGVVLHTQNNISNFLPRMWKEYPSFDGFLKALVHNAGLQADALAFNPNIYIYQIEKAEDKPIIKE